METNVPYIERMTDRQAKDEIYRLRERLVDNLTAARKAEQRAFVEGWLRALGTVGERTRLDAVAWYWTWKDEETAAGIRASLEAGREP